MKRQAAMNALLEADALPPGVQVINLAGEALTAQQVNNLLARLPGVADSLALAQAMQERHVMMAPGRIFSVDPQAVSPWSRFNVGAVLDARFAKALEGVLRSGNGAG